MIGCDNRWVRWMEEAEPYAADIRNGVTFNTLAIYNAMPKKDKRKKGRKK